MAAPSMRCSWHAVLSALNTPANPRIAQPFDETFQATSFYAVWCPKKDKEGREKQRMKGIITRPPLLSFRQPFNIFAHRSEVDLRTTVPDLWSNFPAGTVNITRSSTMESTSEGHVILEGRYRHEVHGVFETTVVIQPNVGCNLISHITIFAL
ncbi:hypothetical protein BDY19DRAFT_905907 [Irpex rosettiformis]|uniref:Uncharacterized protein n=1 Tax=Irpex rosettiformis TaxID=378272 RepID=A0ACB8U5X3_9APHY|nr:hypothetical protein BDY19DRAFT_905907 [Irpex rosettiformis]